MSAGDDIQNNNIFFKYARNVFGLSYKCSRDRANVVYRNRKLVFLIFKIVYGWFFIFIMNVIT